MSSRGAKPPNERLSAGYLGELTLRLADGLRGWDKRRTARHRDFLLGHQQPDGGFSGRRDGSDPYYTSFAVRGLYLLNELERPVRTPVADYLTHSRAAPTQSARPAALIDQVGWLFTAATLALVGGVELSAGGRAVRPAAFEAYRASDGGYARRPAGTTGSTYLTFLVALSYEIIGHPPPQADALVAFVLGRRRADGGFVEIAAMRRSGTNPTAAATTLLHRFDRLDPQVRAGVRSYLAQARDPAGGFRANLRAPGADLLSTFTALATAEQLGLQDVVDREATARFVERLELPGGGYVGTAWDAVADPEYTFYGLGTIALLRR